MNNDIDNVQHPTTPTKGKVIAGIVLLVVGGSLLLKQTKKRHTKWKTWQEAIGYTHGLEENEFTKKKKRTQIILSRNKRICCLGYLYISHNNHK